MLFIEVRLGLTQERSPAPSESQKEMEGGGFTASGTPQKDILAVAHCPSPISSLGRSTGQERGPLRVSVALVLGRGGACRHCGRPHCPCLCALPIGGGGGGLLTKLGWQTQCNDDCKQVQAFPPFPPQDRTLARNGMLSTGGTPGPDPLRRPPPPPCRVLAGKCRTMGAEGALRKFCLT